MVQEWEAQERERYLYHHPITKVTQGLLRNVGLLKYYEEATSLKGHSGLLVQWICWWDVHQQTFYVGPHMWYQPCKDYIYFITSLSKRGEDFTQFFYVPLGVAIEIQLIYSQRYVGDHVVPLPDFQVPGGQLQIFSFGSVEVRGLSLLVITIAHSTNDWKHISFPLLFYVNSLVQRPRCIRWSVIFSRQFCMVLDRCRVMIHGRSNVPQSYFV